LSNTRTINNWKQTLITTLFRWIKSKIYLIIKQSTHLQRSIYSFVCSVSFEVLGQTQNILILSLNTIFRKLGSFGQSVKITAGFVHCLIF